MIGPSFRRGRGPAADGHVRATNTGHDYDDTLAGDICRPHRAGQQAGPPIRRPGGPSAIGHNGAL